MKQLNVATTALGAIMVLAGCATYSSNAVVGNDMSYASLAEQREAALTVKVYETMPANATVIAPIDAGRCHRSFVETAPNEQLVTIDLKVAAYALGANGITNVNVEKKSALTKNCWYMMNGTATAITVGARTDD